MVFILKLVRGQVGCDLSSHFIKASPSCVAYSRNSVSPRVRVLQQFVIGPHKLLHIKTSFTHAELKLRLLLMSGSRFHGRATSPSSTHNSHSESTRHTETQTLTQAPLAFREPELRRSSSVVSRDPETSRGTDWLTYWLTG